jgi:hypothetical protein
MSIVSRPTLKLIECSVAWAPRAGASDGASSAESAKTAAGVEAPPGEGRAAGALGTVNVKVSDVAR